MPSKRKGSLPIRILLADDSEIFSQTVIEFLARQEGLCIVAVAVTSDDLLEKAQQYQPQIILLDMTLPGAMNGMEMTAHLHAVVPDIYIIVLTLLDARRYRQAALDAGANAFVSKSRLTTDLLPAIQGTIADVR